MSVKVDPPMVSDFLLDEAPSGRSRLSKTVLSGQTLKRGHLVVFDSAGKAKAYAGAANEIHTFTLTGTPTSGTWTLKLLHKDGYWVTVGPFAYNVAEATVLAAINALLGTSAVAITLTGAGTAVTALAVTFSGTGYASTCWPLGYLNFSSLIGATAVAVTRSTPSSPVNEKITFTTTGTLTAGSFVFKATKYDQTRVECRFAFNAAIADIQTAINAVLGTSAVTVSGATVAAFTVEWTGAPYTNKPQPAPECSIDLVTGATALAIDRLSDEPDGVCLETVDATGGDKARVSMLIQDAVLDVDALTFGGFSPTWAVESLKLKGIKAIRESTAQSRQ